MFPGLFQSTTVPILEQMVNFGQARHTVLAGNLANLHTPGYQARDLSVEEFQTRLKQAIEARDQRSATQSPGDLAASWTDMAAQAAEDPKSILFHDQSDNSVELQVTEMVKNQLQHNLALAILTSQFRLLQAAVSERV
jgi:flagellar basal-body rod protein FlgB